MAPYTRSALEPQLLQPRLCIGTSTTSTTTDGFPMQSGGAAPVPTQADEGFSSAELDLGGMFNVPPYTRSALNPQLLQPRLCIGTSTTALPPTAFQCRAVVTAPDPTPGERSRIPYLQEQAPCVGYGCPIPMQSGGKAPVPTSPFQCRAMVPHLSRPKSTRAFPT